MSSSSQYMGSGGLSGGSNMGGNWGGGMQQSSLSGGSGGGSSTSMYGGNINDLMQRQLADNAWARQNNLAEWTQAKGQLLNVPGQYMSDPMRQGSRALMSQMLANPEAINDRTQQLAVNRGSNLINAASNSRMNSYMGDAASMGQLGSSSMQSGYNQIENGRMGQLMGMGSDLEIQRAKARNDDMYRAISASQGLAQQDYGVNKGVADTYIQNLPQFRADDLSGLISTMSQMQMQAGGQGGMQAMQGGNGGGAGGGGSQFGPSLTGWNQQGQSVSQYGTAPNNANRTSGNPYYGLSGGGYQLGNVYGLNAPQGATNVQTGGAGQLSQGYQGQNQYQQPFTQPDPWAEYDGEATFNQSSIQTNPQLFQQGGSSISGGWAQ